MPVFAADEAPRAAAASVAAATTLADMAAAVTIGSETAVGVAEALPPVVRVPEFKSSRRPMFLPSLYASYAALQVYDVYSTTRAIAGGAHEANPMMKAVVGNPAVFWTLKAVTTVAPMMAAERLWKTNKVGAIALMAASNGMMAARIRPGDVIGSR
jgi:hypothetical protein